MHHSRHLAVAALAASGLLLSACSGEPGVAVQVGSFTYSRDDLAVVTQAQCALAGGQQQGIAATSRATVAQSTVALVAQARQSVAYARSHDVSVSRTELDRARSDFAQQLDGTDVTRAQRSALLDVSDLVSRGQLIQQAVGAERLGLPAGGAVGAAAQQAVRAGGEVIAAWAARSGPDVRFDPRYNLALRQGQLTLRDSSVSVPVSGVGKQSASEQPSRAYVTSLPVPQRCG